jgi:hypothetical protein
MYHGHDLLLFATEDFDPDRLVTTKHGASKSIPIMMYRQIRTFKTELDRHVLDLSVFSPVIVPEVPLRGMRAVTPLRTSFSEQSSTGTFFEQLRASREGFHRLVYSKSEPDRQSTVLLPHDRNLILEDDLLLRMRELVAPFPAGSYRVITSSLYGRIEERAPTLERVTVTRRIVPDQVTAFGVSPVIEFAVLFPVSKRRLRVSVLGNGGKQILGWKRDGVAGTGGKKEEATLLTSTRTTAWNLRGPAGEKVRKRLELPKDLVVPESK